MKKIFFQFAVFVTTLCSEINGAGICKKVVLESCTYEAGEYSLADYEKYPAYRSIIIDALTKDKQAPPVLAYILQDQINVVCVFGDAFGDISYVAQCYSIVDSEHFKMIGEIKYVNKNDFDVPELRGGFLHIRSKGSKTRVSFDINQTSMYVEDIKF